MSSDYSSSNTNSLDGSFLWNVRSIEMMENSDNIQLLGKAAWTWPELWTMREWLKNVLLLKN